MSAIQRGVLHDLAADTALTNASTPLMTCCAHGSVKMTCRGLRHSQQSGLVPCHTYCCCPSCWLRCARALGHRDGPSHP
eukprot:7366233-Alexandrium_andersonii.AAC.1